MDKTTFHLDGMDCPSEEQMVRTRLQDLTGVEHLDFDLSHRRVAVYHSSPADEIEAALGTLNLGATRVDHAVDVEAPEAGAPEERGPLIAALVINALLFVAEIVAGLLAGSMGLIADALDMLADAIVYALSLAAVGGTASRKKRLARWSGYMQFSLALVGLVEVGRRFLFAEEVPDVATMVVVASIALVANVATLVILARARRDEAHVQASWIFTSNDIKVNLLVIASALVVWATASQIPDLVAGALIFGIVANGARRILALSR